MWLVEQSVSGTNIQRLEAERPAPQRPPNVIGHSFNSWGIVDHTGRNRWKEIDVEAPLDDIAMHIEQPKVVRL